MNTPLSLRVQFKMETGYYPVWETESRTRILPSSQKEKAEFACTFRGNPKTIYGQWLEENLWQLFVKSSNELQEMYKSETGENPVELLLYRRNANKKFSVKYTLWLEEYFIYRYKILDRFMNK